MATLLKECLECPAKPVCIRGTCGGRTCREVAKRVEEKLTTTNTARATYRLLSDIHHDTKVFLGTELRVRIAEWFRDTPPVA